MFFINYDEVKNELAGAIATVSGLQPVEITKLLVAPPTLEMGHLAFGCFVLAKTLKKAPGQIAIDLAEKLGKEKVKYAQKWVAVGPYLNVFLDTAAVAQNILTQINSGKYFKQKLTEKTPKTMIEYSQPNTHKELHVGHMRNLCLGDAIVKLHRYCGFEVIASTFPGDVGTHVAKCLWYMKKHNKEKVPTKKKGAWLGSLYTKSNNLLEEQKGTEKEEENRQELTAILHQLHDGKGEYFDLWKETRKWSIELMQEVYDWAGVKFDKWYWESDVDAKSVSLIQEYVKKGLFVKDQGAIGIDLSQYKLGFCLLLKSDGTGLYATKDIELARMKFEDFKIEKSVYVVDKRQAHHFKQVFKTLELMGFKEAQNCYHLAYDFVELPEGAMSSRQGNIVPLQDLIEQMTQTIEKEHLEKYATDWKSDEIKKVAKDVAAGAIKFGMNKIDPMKSIVFDMKEWLKLDGESGPYIQYVHARINSMIEKINPKIATEKIDWGQLVKQQETYLILKLAEFHSVIQVATETYRTSHLCNYLYDLAKLFNSFYAECPIAKAETEELKNARLALSLSVKTILARGLELLGIVAPHRM